MDMLINWFAEPLSYPFMQMALFTAIIVAIVCAILSCYLVLKGWSLMGDAISHAVLPGIVVAYISGLPLMFGAFLSGLFCSLAIGYLKENSRIKEDTVMGIVFSGMFAFGLVLFVKVESDQHLTHVLFGNLLGVGFNDFLQIMIISIMIFMIMLLKRRDFLLFCFDPSHARVVGLSPRVLHYGLLILLALTIVAAMQVVGVILVVAMLISPGITAFMLTKKFDTMIAIAMLSSVLSSFLGTLISFHLNADIGPCIILLQAVIFVLALLYSKFKIQQIQPLKKLKSAV
ncbi:metal ABC transporter permease [Lonepinella koalarum]|uniref:Manganese/iron transport system permease protein n=1 Tax=Lonepinella koalarum TaxID=53417 RepID=A0A4R1KZ53_9PAST|nr:metal ABC transporter permease [Lonepinella koalarum]MDH2927686.1 iron ABC transporter permease [Lonepinella koalarum]TCK69880.1 manganese/iron transport system permease protein [Lonepinella koalarum]TFJ90512.1 metal ABC transporter permease [Lonepinella koalarum]TYG35209.1 metal ABC transporter permease [Lonepinella koalarum]